MERVASCGWRGRNQRKMGKMRSYLKKIQKEIILFVTAGSSAYIFSGFLPYFIKRMFEGAYVEAVVGYCVCLAAYILFSYLTNLSQVVYKNKFDTLVKKDYFDKAFSLREEAFQKKEVGEYISFQVNDITEISENYLNPFVGILLQGIRIVIVLIIILFVLNYQMTLLLCAATALSIMLPKSLGKETAKRRAAYLGEQKVYYSRMEDFYHGHKVSNNRTIRRITSLHGESLDHVLKERIHYGKANSLMWTINGLGIECINLLIFLYLGFLLFKGSVSAGFAIAAFQYTRSLMEPVQEILYNKSLLHSMDEVIQAFLDFINTDKGANQADNFVHADQISGRDDQPYILVQKLSISWNNFQFGRIDLEIQKHKKYALIGVNGSGKSTLFHVLASQIDAYEGDVYFRGINIRDRDLSNYIGVLNQDEFVFSADHRDNTTVFGSYDEIKENPFCTENRKILESGDCSVLSGGEKNLLNLERAYNENTEVLLLDEPLAAVDEGRKDVLLNKILSMEKTIIMVTHDVGKSLERFDSVILMKNGQILYNLPYAQIVDRKEFVELKDSMYR